MNNIRFHIFGVPDGFDIYQEVIDMENKIYYQCFYDESIKEQTRLAINRKPNGDVSYTYLKYHLYSNGNRPNAFFGLSVVFSNGYYADVSSLYNLLEQTYNSILQKGKLLNPIANGSSARFAVNKFSEEPLEIKRIESIVIGTLSTKEYFAEYIPFDSSFEIGKQNAILKVPFQIYDNETQEKEANLLVVEKLKKFSWLSLSPDYLKKEDSVLSGEIPSIKHIELDEELDPVTKAQYINSFEKYQSQVLAAFEKLVSKTDENLMTNVKQLDSIVKGILVSLREYGKKQNELKDLLDKYSGLAEKLDTLSDKLLEDKDDEHNNNGKQWQHYLFVACGVIAAVCIVVFFCKLNLRPNNPGVDTPVVVPTDTVPQENTLEQLLKMFNQALQNNEFDTAICYYKQVNDTVPKKCKLDESLNEKFKTLIEAHNFDGANNLYKNLITRICENPNSYINKLKESFKSYIRDNKSNIDIKKDLIEKIEKAKDGKYDYDGIDNDLNEIKNLGTVSSSNTDRELSVYCEEDKKEVKKASDIIEIEVNKLYIIKNSRWVNDAIFGYYKPNTTQGKWELVPTGSGKDAAIKIKAQGIMSGETVTIYYCKKNEKKEPLFTFQIKVIESKTNNRNELKVD